MTKCIKGHYQPLLLLYADPRGTPVSTQDLPPQVDLQQYSRTCYDSEDSGKQCGLCAMYLHAETQHVKCFPSLECIIVSRGPCCLLTLIKNSEDFQCFICELLLV